MEFGASTTPPVFGVRREIDRIVGDAFTRKPRDRRRAAPAPAMVMRETDRELTVTIEIPDAFAGIDISVRDGVLTICERTLPAAHDAAHDALHSAEHGASDRRDSSFQQSVQLPKDTDERAIGWQITGSVLTVHIPKVRPAAIHHHAALTHAATSEMTSSVRTPG
jgi:HSP20 family molecular chaperone IbpA